MRGNNSESEHNASEIQTANKPSRAVESHILGKTKGVFRPTLSRWRKLAHLGWTLARAGGLRTLTRLAKGGLNGTLVQVENTNYCNYHCRYCPTHSRDSRLPLTRGHMSQETFRAILERNPRACHVVIQGQGEPLLDPGVFDKIALARSAGLVTQIISNGSMLSDKMIERLVVEGPDVLLFSIDAVSPERNMQQRQGMKYADVVRGIEKLNGRRARSRRSMIVGILSIVHEPFGAESEQALLDFDRLGVDGLLYKQLNPSYENRINDYAASPIEDVPASVLRSLGFPLSHQRLATKRPCAQLRHGMPYYLLDGRETPCCVLNDARYTTPEFSRTRLLERYAQRRMPEECVRCSFFGGYEAK